MDYQIGIPRTQVQITSWETEVEQDSFARVIDLLVDALPLDKLGFKHIKLGNEGNQPYHPKDLLKLLLYGYRFKLRSSYELSTACKINIEIKWLINDLKPSPRTISYFRVNNMDAIQEAHRYFIRILKEWKLVEGKAVAVDGMKIRGQNSTKNNFNKRKIDRHIKYIDGQIGDYLRKMDDVDKKEKPDSEDRERKVKAQVKIDQYKERLKKFEILSQQVEASEDGQVSIIDPDAKAICMPHNNNGVGYNIQATVDMKNQIIVDVRTGGINDMYELSPMAMRAQEITGEKEIQMAADAGYHNGIEIAAVEKMGVLPYVAEGKKGLQTEEGYAKSDFTYDSDSDAYQCPAGSQLKTNGQYHVKKNGKSQHRVKRYTTNLCSECVVRNLCTDNVKGRVIERSEYQDAVDRNNARVKKYRSFYQLRQQTVEPVFGTWRRFWHMGHTLLKSRKKVETEYRLAAISYNLLRAVSVLGIAEVKNKLKEAILFIFRLWCLIWGCIRVQFNSTQWRNHTTLNFNTCIRKTYAS